MGPVHKTEEIVHFQGDLFCFVLSKRKLAKFLGYEFYLTGLCLSLDHSLEGG